MAATLNSWKEIAVYLNRGVRTAQRWEREQHLPVHRIGVGPRAPVFAFTDELAVWHHGFASRLSDQNASLSPLPLKATRVGELKRQRELLRDMRRLREIHETRLAALLNTVSAMETRARLSASNRGEPMLKPRPLLISVTSAA